MILGPKLSEIAENQIFFLGHDPLVWFNFGHCGFHGDSLTVAIWVVNVRFVYLFSDVPLDLSKNLSQFIFSVCPYKSDTHHSRLEPLRSLQRNISTAFNNSYPRFLENG